MKRNKKLPQTTKEVSCKTEIDRGEIKDNFLAALVTSKVYKMRVIRAKKGKGSFKRKSKHQGKEPYLIAA